MSETQHTIQSTRLVNCRSCWTEGRCLVEITLNDTGRVTSAQVLNYEQGWTVRPYGEVGGQAPYCPKCS